MISTAIEVVMRILFLVLALSSGIASAQTQSTRVDEYGRPDDNDVMGLPDPNTVRPATYTTPGQAEVVAKAMAGRLIAAAKGERYCEREGCLVLVNANRDYRLTGFFVAKDIGASGSDPSWSRNKLSASLPPLMAVAMPKKGGPEACATHVRFKLSNIHRKEELAVEGVADMCRRPGVDSMIRVRVVRPIVRIEPPLPGDP
ncbi:hypothetical protein [Sphingomonas sp.]|uniref:hypothetical protein n=1 Tax=Sphingomonas sp. TaxID=28214 RepID=UPI001EC2667D|nr:hypothetical protein [Sphingomonas sp.]MBX3593880.1 hypothetical protein [Sphingomonas sp.]